MMTMMMTVMMTMMMMSMSMFTDQDVGLVELQANHQGLLHVTRNTGNFLGSPQQCCKKADQVISGEGVQMQSYPPLWQLHSDHTDFNNSVCRVKKIPITNLMLIWNSYYNKHFAFAPVFWLETGRCPK